ncbi:MAG: hypothetical protein NC313_02960 [Butyrivibrio sp.]|nr:hypothetical protein [Butyrivibrio sp.]
MRQYPIKITDLVVEEDAPLPDEVEAIREAKQEIERGELYSHEEVWG